MTKDKEFEKKYKKKLAEIYFDKGKFEDAKHMIHSIKTNDLSSLMNLGCIYYK
jgi:predicted negative regulator of RcsB-dependent stress response